MIFIRERKNSYPVKVVANVGDFPVGAVKIISYPNDEHPCFLLHPSEGIFLAFSRLCTHAACPIFYRPEQQVFACPCHGGVFWQPTAPSSMARPEAASARNPGIAGRRFDRHRNVSELNLA